MQGRERELPVRSIAIGKSLGPFRNPSGRYFRQGIPRGEGGRRKNSKHQQSKLVIPEVKHFLECVLLRLKN